MSELHAFAGSYALNALDAPELSDYESHLQTCEACQDDVVDFCETAAELALLSLATPPPELRNRILAEISNTPQLPAEEVDASPGPPESRNGSRPAEHALPAVRSSGPRRALPGTDAAEEADPAAAPPLDELAIRRQRRRNRLLSALVAAMLALAVGLGGVVYSLVQQRQAQVAQIPLEQQLYAAPDATFTTTELKGGGTATFVISKELNRALFIGTDLPDPGRDKRYQLWTMTGPEPKWVVASSVTRDNQVADRDPAVKVFFRGDVVGADFLCVNVEPVSNTGDRPTVPPSGSVEV